MMKRTVDAIGAIAGRHHDTTLGAIAMALRGQRSC